LDDGEGEKRVCFFWKKSGILVVAMGRIQLESKKTGMKTKRQKRCYAVVEEEPPWNKKAKKKRLLW
jgi:hypothetical protein